MFKNIGKLKTHYTFGLFDLFAEQMKDLKKFIYKMRKIKQIFLYFLEQQIDLWIILLEFLFFSYLLPNEKTKIVDLMSLSLIFILF